MLRLLIVWSLNCRTGESTIHRPPLPLEIPAPLKRAVRQHQAEQRKQAQSLKLALSDFAVQREA